MVHPGAQKEQVKSTTLCTADCSCSQSSPSRLALQIADLMNFHKQDRVYKPSPTLHLCRPVTHQEGFLHRDKTDGPLFSSVGVVSQHQKSLPLTATSSVRVLTAKPTKLSMAVCLGVHTCSTSAMFGPPRRLHHARRRLLQSGGNRYSQQTQLRSNPASNVQGSGWKLARDLSRLTLCVIWRQLEKSRRLFQ